MVLDAAHLLLLLGRFFPQLHQVRQHGELHPQLQSISRYNTAEAHVQGRTMKNDEALESIAR